MGRRLIGWHGISSLGVFFYFNVRMTCATFHFAEKYPLSRAALSNWVRYFIPIIGSYFRVLPVMTS
jgi:hypothetical protein